jgi:hypothetical protein
VSTRNGGCSICRTPLPTLPLSAYLSGLIRNRTKADQSAKLICFLNAIELVVLRERHGCEFMPRCGRSSCPVSQGH